MKIAQQRCIIEGIHKVQDVSHMLNAIEADAVTGLVLSKAVINLGIAVKMLQDSIADEVER